MKCRYWRLLYLVLLGALVACSDVTAVPTVWPTAIVPVLPTAVPASPVPVGEPTPLPPTAVSAEPIGITAVPGIPSEIVAAAQQIAQQNPAQFRWVDGAADVTLTWEAGRPLAQWVYVAAAPFATVTDEVDRLDLTAAWQGAGDWAFVAAEWDAAAAAVLLGEGGAAAVVLDEQLVGQLWEVRPSLTLVPFDELTPELKVMYLDGVSPLAPDFAAESWPLTLAVNVVGEDTAVNQFLTAWNGPTTNRDPAKMTRVAMTGVTALVRATAYNMEQFGILWPGEEVGPVLRGADIAHISNEVSFAPDCPYPNPIGGTTFCSRDSYFALIEDVGADVIELTGNHLNDWGGENTLRTIAMYEAAGMQTFGGGGNLAEAAQPALFEHNGNKIAFVGCNHFGPAFAWATETSPGSRPCDGSMLPQISQLRDEGYLVIATLQYEEYYQYPPLPQQEADFKALAAAGATAVSGSQGHHVQGFAFADGAFIHYGPGNLFFDQMDMLGTRQTFVDTYVIYDGRLLSVELWTGLIENYARPRVMTAVEREQALRTLFQASGW